VAFTLSRTATLFGFTETGWQPSPYAAITVIAEVLTLLLVGTTALRQRPRASKGLPLHQGADGAREPSSRRG
jgi:hypothetical protein